MTHNYLIAELSVRLGELQATAVHDAAPELAALRQQVETGPPPGLRAAAVQALALADRLCWQSLSRGDIAAFTSATCGSRQTGPGAPTSPQLGTESAPCPRPPDQRQAIPAIREGASRGPWRPPATRPVSPGHRHTPTLIKIH
jgi:hypothetical protein